MADPLSTAGLLDQAMSRAAGAPRLGGNRVRVLRDADENYPAWLAAIRGARQSIRFEQYLMRDDRVGRLFADALIERAEAGVPVRLLHDWFGCLGTAGPRYWRRLRAAGVEVVSVARPQFAHPFRWVRRDHRKTIVVDDAMAFVSGLCVADTWAGLDGVAPWRDTGLVLEGPAVTAVATAFDRLWADVAPTPAWSAPAVGAVGDVAVRVIASAPRSSRLFRLDQLVAAAATTRLWLSDSYYVGTAPYVQALRAAARDGVDVRLLVPDAGDVAWLRPLSRAGYRPLLDAGVRVFEWNGPMLHTKTAVADGRWCRVGSTNLNLASWIGNWELDVAIEDTGVAAVMEAHFLEDLETATEIVLHRRTGGRARVVVAPSDVEGRSSESASEPSSRSTAEGSREVLRELESAKSLKGMWLRPKGRMRTRRAAAGALRLTNAVGAALLDQRALGPAEARLEFLLAIALLALGAAAFIWPKLVVVPFAAGLVWIGLASLVRAVRRFASDRRTAAADAVRPDAP